MASRSIKMNQLESRISIVNDDLKIVFEKYKSKSYDVVICNPPYHVKGSGNISPNHIQAIARYEIACTLEDVVKAANYLLQDHGRIFMILKPQRLFELLCLLEKYKLFLHKIRFVHPNLNEKANSVLVESIKKGKKSMEVMMPFIVYDNNGVYTKELNDIYYPKE
ncbi:methyltransferase [Candidatus Desantisbacteria bacterium]|nr:methyltransferase [Candidatus Desantisbacteria bacterium]